MKLEKVNWVSITTRLWTSVNTASYLALTIHFWDDDSSILQSFVLDCLRIKGRHTSLRLEDELRSILIKHEVMSKIVVGVIDNGANIVKALRDIDIRQVPCYAHTLNLVAPGSIKDAPALIKVKDTASKIVEQTKRSPVVQDKFEDIQRNRGHTRIKKLIQDVPTRWNSTFEMMERLVELRGAVAELLTELGMSTKVGVVDSNTWQVLGEAVEVLQPLFEGTLELSGEKLTTGSKAIPLTTMLMFRYDHLIEESDPGSIKCQLAKAIRGNPKRRFGALEDITELAIATLLDPRFKVNGSQSSVKKDVAVEKLELVINMELQKV
ncbi:zinc finger BED domain-containing protein 4-like [Tigriopus californicus]|uniref:zinc finger BED domain-containing protein 4-like n=1 Tax=Tigriopus californicus TaxID=6832 RepID=UPI0027DA69EE|nr:zinc finger BED domain-containing protein 4-like [Tigriopus californicus]